MNGEDRALPGFWTTVRLLLGASLDFAILVGIGFEAWRRFEKHRGRDVLGDEIEA